MIDTVCGIKLGLVFISPHCLLLSDFHFYMCELNA